MVANNPGIRFKNIYGPDLLDMQKIFAPYAKLFPMGVTVEYNAGMRTALGRANITKNIIKLNNRLLQRHPEHLLSTFAHELAHLVVNALYGPEENHGPNFFRINRQMGFNPVKHHNLDTSFLKRRNGQVQVVCGCGPRFITKSRYTRMQNGTRYRCNTCKQEIG